MRYLVEGHARVCIEAMGYLVATGTTHYADGTREYWALATRPGDVPVPVPLNPEERGPTLAVALVRLLLTLPSAEATP